MKATLTCKPEYTPELNDWLEFEYVFISPKGDLQKNRWYFFFPKINAVLGGQKAFREWLNPHDIYTGAGGRGGQIPVGEGTFGRSKNDLFAGYFLSASSILVWCILPLKLRLVGGFKHFLFSIIYGIILPID